MDQDILVFGNEGISGTYLLLVHILESIEIPIGKLMEGRSLEFDQGFYVYVGSALGRSGTSTLSYRLLRHGIRTDESYHPVYKSLLRELDRWGNPYSLASSKTCFWHIDYLLEHPKVLLEKLIIIRKPEVIEEEIVEMISEVNDIGSVTGFGSSDSSMPSHLFKLNYPENVLKRIVDNIEIIFNNKITNQEI